MKGDSWACPFLPKWAFFRKPCSAKWHHCAAGNQAACGPCSKGKLKVVFAVPEKWWAPFVRKSCNANPKKSGLDVFV